MKRGSNPAAFQILLPSTASTCWYNKDHPYPGYQGLPFTSVTTWKSGKGVFLSHFYSGKDYSIGIMEFKGFIVDVFRVKAVRPLILLIYVGSGSIELIFKDSLRESWGEKTYGAIYVPKGVHTFKAAESSVTLVIPSLDHIGEYDYLADLGKQVLSSGKGAVSLSACKITDGVHRILYRLMHCTKKGIKLQLSVQSYILDLLNTYGRQLKAKGSQNLNMKKSSVQDIADHILLHLKGGSLLNTSQLAKRFFTTRKMLDKDFKDVYNESVYQFIHRERMQLSKTMLLTTLSVQKTAYAAGYEDVFTFSKAFKRWWGIAPSEVWK